MTTPGPGDHDAPFGTRPTPVPTDGSVSTDAPEVVSDPGSSPSSASGEAPISRGERLGLRLASGLIAAMLLTLLFDVWAGPRSAFRYGALRAEAAEARSELAELERKTSRAVFALRALQKDPKAYERLLAEEFGVAPEGATVISFDDTDE